VKVKAVLFIGAALSCISGGFVVTALILSGVAFWLYLNSKHDQIIEYLANQTERK